MKRGILSVGAGNFRKFKEFTQVPLNQLTLLTGANGSGKSTMSKALQLLIENLKYRNTSSARSLDFNLKMPFTFDSNKFEEINIGNFARAICEEGADNELITFYTDILDYDVTDAISLQVDVRKGNNQIDGEVAKVKISSALRKVDILVDFDNSKIDVRLDLYQSRIWGEDATEEDEDVDCHLDNCDEENEKFEENEKKYLSLYSVEEILNSNESAEKNFAFSLSKGEISGIVIDSMITPGNRPLIADIIYALGNHYLEGCNLSEIDLSDDEIKLLCSKRAVFREIAWAVQSVIDGNDIIYDHAHTSSHNALFSIKDKNDYAAKTVHNLYRAGLASSEIKPISGDDWIRRFILKWMDADHFSIGSGYEVININEDGESYAVKIKDFNGKTLDLCDFGSGTIQLITLLFRIATYLKNYRMDRRNVVVIIEEPEQNLHPKMQSKLADFFYDIFSNDEIRNEKEVVANFNLIIETHSEYLIRRSQVIVGENYGTEDTLSDNPFNVIYFPEEGEPYDLVYTKSGMFQKKFGPGFLDEAGKLHMNVLKKSRG